MSLFEIHETQNILQLVEKILNLKQHLKNNYLNNIILYLFSEKGQHLHAVIKISFDFTHSFIAIELQIMNQTMLRQIDTMIPAHDTIQCVQNEWAFVGSINGQRTNNCDRSSILLRS
jgi:hypothetical protein